MARLAMSSRLGSSSSSEGAGQAIGAAGEMQRAITAFDDIREHDRHAASNPLQRRHIHAGRSEDHVWTPVLFLSKTRDLSCMPALGRIVALHGGMRRCHAAELRRR